MKICHLGRNICLLKVPVNMETVAVPTGLPQACMGDDGFGTPVCAYGYEQSPSNTLCVQCETERANRHYKKPGTGECLKCPANL